MVQLLWGRKPRHALARAAVLWLRRKSLRDLTGPLRVTRHPEEVVGGS